MRKMQENGKLTFLFHLKESLTSAAWDIGVLPALNWGRAIHCIGEIMHFDKSQSSVVSKYFNHLPAEIRNAGSLFTFCSALQLDYF